MKKGQEYSGIVKQVRFPNKGVVCVPGEDDRCIVKNTVAGQKVRFRVDKKRNGSCEGYLLDIEERSPLEIDSPCPHFEQCGGCTYQTLSYSEQLKLKEEQVHELLDAVITGGADTEVDIKSLYEPIISSPVQFEYRNKMEFSFGDASLGGDLELGLHKRGSFYDIITVGNCRIVDDDYRSILSETLSYFRGKETTYYHKRTHEGFLRFLVIRKAAATSEILIDLVTTSQLPKDTICTEVSLLEDWKESLLSLKLSGKIVGILHTTDDSVSDAIINERTDLLFGRDYFNEEVLGLSFKITPFSFFQTNTLSAEVLYSKVREYVSMAVGSDENNAGRVKTVYDLYSGTGTIGQLMSTVADQVIGVEIVEEAVKAANENARLNGLHNCRFIAGDVLKVLDEIEEKPDLIILDPPRDGINPKALAKIARYGVDNIIYVSCKPTSLARDLEYLMANGYSPVRICPIDQFPATVHVECVVLLTQRKPDMSIEITMTEEDLELTRAEAKATYKEITDYVQTKYGLRVPNLYVAQVKREFGIIERENYNKGKEGHQIPQVTPEKREAIIDALRFYKMIV